MSRSPSEVYGDLDADILHEKIATYRSEAADENRRWIAFIDIGGGAYLPTYFVGRTEVEASENAQAFWHENRAAREAKILNRRESRAKFKQTMNQRRSARRQKQAAV